MGRTRPNAVKENILAALSYAAERENRITLIAV
jgi:hypothetical protein